MEIIWKFIQQMDIRFRLLVKGVIMKSLNEHHIREIRTLKVRSRYTRTIGKNARIRHHGDGPDSQIRVITTDQGAMGWGISWIPDDKMPDLIGRSIGELFDSEIGVIDDTAMPIDFPLHDLAGVILDMPVYKMLDAKGDTAIPCYDGAIYMDDLTPEESPRGISAVLKSCQDDYDYGFRDFKIKIGRGFQWMGHIDGFKRDVDIVHAVHKAFPESRILVDANDGYTCDDMIKFIDKVSDCNIYWIEEPFRENRENLIKLKDYLSSRNLNIFIADGEGGWDIDFLLQMGKERLIDVLQMDTGGFGFTEWRKIMPKIIEMGILASPHTWGDPLKVCYTAHLSAGFGNIPTIEGIPSNTLNADLSDYKLIDGILHISEDAPGFGMRLKITL